MSFPRDVLERLTARPDHVFVQEARGEELRATEGAELRRAVERVRAFLREAGLGRGDRCALLAANSTAWIACNLGIIAEGVVAVPLYARQKPAELARILRDCEPGLLLAEDAELAAAVRAELAGGPPLRTPAEAIAPRADGKPDAPPVDPVALEADDPVAVIYTSGTSGEPKGAILTRGNVDFMLGRTVERLDELMEGHDGPDRAFHFLPWCFAGAWIALLACLRRGTVLTVNTDLTRIVEDLKSARPHWFQTVPVVLERVRDGVEQALRRQGGLIASFLTGALRATMDRAANRPVGWLDGVKLAVARRSILPPIRRRIGGDLRALICGSAPLSPETQLFFEMLGLPVLQVYGLTETTAICTMDRPGDARAGRVGRAVDGVEMRIGDDDEILVRGPNVFPGYWNRPDATERAFAEGWLRTGDRGDQDGEGRWRILGRLRNLIVLGSGHNVAPEPLEHDLQGLLPEAKQVLLVGNGQPHLLAVVTGGVEPAVARAALERLNADLPHYRRIHGSLLLDEPFTVESGLVTANGKLRRGAIAEALATDIAEAYVRKESAA